MRSISRLLYKLLFALVHYYLVSPQETQSCEMSIILHRVKPSDQILPLEKRSNIGTLIQTEGIILENKCCQLYCISAALFRNIFVNLQKKAWFLANSLYPQTFNPNLPIFLHEYIPHILDILQLWRNIYWNFNNRDVHRESWNLPNFEKFTLWGFPRPNKMPSGEGWGQQMQILWLLRPAPSSSSSPSGETADWRSLSQQLEKWPR